MAIIIRPVHYRPADSWHYYRLRTRINVAEDSSSVVGETRRGVVVRRHVLDVVNAAVVKFALVRKRKRAARRPCANM